MKNKFLNLVRTDLIQAKLLNENSNLNYLKLILFFLKSRTCRIHLFIRLRNSNTFLSYISKKYLDMYFIEIGKDTQIGEYFFLPHPRCIIIANDVKIGQHVHVAQYVTIGGNFKKTKISFDGRIQKFPIIGNRVMIHPSAVIGGPITIGDDVIVGANSVITKDVISNSIVYSQNKIAKKRIIVFPSGGEIEILKEEKEV